MSLRDRRIVSSVSPEAAAIAAKRIAEGKDPVTGKKCDEHKPGCPTCEVKPGRKEKHGEGGAA